MNGSWLAQADVSNWIEWLVPTVIVVLAVLGNITKALTKAKSKKEQKRSVPPPPVHRRKPHPPTPPRPVARPAPARPAPVRPVAKPMPAEQRKRVTTVATVPPAPPRRSEPHQIDSLPDMLKEVFGQLREAASQAAQPAPKPTPPKPQAPPRRPKARRQTPAPKAPPAPAPPPTEPKTDLRERHLKHLKGTIKLDPALEVDPFAITAHEIGAVRKSVRHPRRVDLRRAIVMNEILSPPLSLRNPDDV